MAEANINNREGETNTQANADNRHGEGISAAGLQERNKVAVHTTAETEGEEHPPVAMKERLEQTQLSLYMGQAGA